MKTELINKAIDSTVVLSELQKKIFKGFVERNREAEQKASDIRSLVSDVSSDRVDEIILSNEDVIVYTVMEDPKNDWSKQYPYRYIYRYNKDTKDNKWIRCLTVSKTFDEAYLDYLGVSKLGTQGGGYFKDFALKMLKNDE
jgi:hypothetical protein